MPNAFVVHYLGVAPISVGSEVEVRVFALDTAVFGTKLEPQFEDPLIVDLATSIMYGAEWHFQDPRATKANSVIVDLPLMPRAELSEHGRWRGHVTATRIANIGSAQMQTSLSIMPTEAGRPYG